MKKYDRLSFSKREEIFKGTQKGKSYRLIAGEHSRDVFAIRREINRNMPRGKISEDGYRIFYSQDCAKWRAAHRRKGKCK